MPNHSLPVKSADLSLLLLLRVLTAIHLLCMFCQTQKRKDYKSLMTKINILLFCNAMFIWNAFCHQICSDVYKIIKAVLPFNDGHIAESYFIGGSYWSRAQHCDHSLHQWIWLREIFCGRRKRNTLTTVCTFNLLIFSNVVQENRNMIQPVSQLFFRSTAF